MSKKIMNSKLYIAMLAVALPVVSQAGGVKYSDGDKYVKIGGRIQLQYKQVKPDAGASTDDLFFRRFRPFIEGSLHKNWKGKFQWDMGTAEGDNEIAIKDAYMQYKSESGIKVSVGNKMFPFSREQMTSSKKQQLIERTFVGDHNYGSPDRQTGLHLEKSGKTVSWAAALVEANIDPDNKKLDFDTAVNKNTDFNEGWMLGGRVEISLGKKAKFSQGDFKNDSKSSIGIGVFSWSNDDDNNTASGTRSPVDSVTGIEVSGAYRGNGVSVDAQYNTFDAETVDPGITNGIYKNGKTTLESMSVEGGYMVVPAEVELVFGYQTLDADNYAEAWNRASLGVNWFVHKHDIKVQLSYRMGENLDGVANNDADEIFLQTQYVF